MNCASCGRATRAESRFCVGCGQAFPPRCPACGVESEVDAQFCGACGAALVAPATPAASKAEARKVVTIVFADLVGSTSLHERLDAESARRLMDRYYSALRAEVEAHGGTVVKLLGDGVMAAFGVPRVAEDDAIRAVRAAVSMQRAFRELARALTPDPSPKMGEGNQAIPPLPSWERGLGGEGLGLRIAVNTGEVVVSDDNTDVVGDPVNVAARLQQEAGDGDVVIGEATRRLVSQLVTLAPLGVFALKGRSERVAAYRVVSLERPAGAAVIAFVGRDDELRRIMAIYDTAVARRGARLAVILGSPGLGKSRLLDEFTRYIGDRATVLTAHCDAAGGATFAPLAEALRVLLHIDEGATSGALRAAIDSVVRRDDAERVRIAAGVTALLAGTPEAPEETFFIVRRLLAALATTQPVVLAIDDLQWAEPLLLDLVEHLVQWSADVPLLLLAAARPELRDARSSLTAPGSLVADVLTLGGLDAAAATRLAANVIGADALPAAVAGRVLATSEGNPLFVGELVRMLVHDGALKQEGDRWTIGVELAALEMPPTIHAVLAARIERLRPEERSVLERAAVVGRHFSRAAVAHLLPRETADLDAQLESLRRSELIESDTGWFLGEPVLRFHHMLIRDAAYRRLLKGTRAELHSRFAQWIESRIGESVEHDETIGWHLEQAHQHLRELGPLNEQGRALGDRAARYLAAAGRRALTRDDLPLAASLLGRALERLDPVDPMRTDLALDWCEALLSTGDVGPAVGAVDELGRFIGDSDRLRAWHTCFAGQLAVLTDPQALRATAEAVAAAVEQLAAAGDAAGEAKAHSVHALALQRLGKIGACEAALDKALAAARRADDRRRSNAVLVGAPLAARWGPSPVTRASGRCLDVVRVLRITQGAPAVEAVALRCQGLLEALRGRTDAARRMIASSRRMVEELGITQRLLEADVFAGHIELLEGDAVAAEHCLRAAYEGLRGHGLGIDAAQAAALLGRALLAQGKAEEAEALSHECEALAGDDLKAAIAWRGVRAEALAQRGEHASAVALARGAVDTAAATDALLDHADACLALATALRAAGRSAEADAEEARAIELWEAKGATLLAKRARRDSGRLTLGDRPPAERPTPAHSARRVRPNAATENATRLDAAIAAHDADVLPTLLADVVEVVHHPTGVVYDRSGALDAWYALLGATDVTFTHEPVATLGDALALFRTAVSFSALPDNDVGLVGAASWDEVILIEVDARGQRRRAEFFAHDRLGNAVTRLYERYGDLLAEGPARTRAAATAYAVAALLGPFDLEHYATAITPEVDFVDHRTVGFPSGRGVTELLRSIGTLLETADNVATCVDDVLSLRTDALLVRWMTSGTDRVSSGPFEWLFLRLLVFGTDGLLTRAEQFDIDRADAALARFDELTSEPAPAPFANAASRAVDRFERCWRERDWDGVVATFAPTHVMDDRRAMMRLHLEGEAYFASLRGVFEAMPSSRWDFVLLATRGERLALLRVEIAGAAGDSGLLVRELFWVVEVDADGRRVALLTFDLTDLEAAHAALDDRYAAGEGAPYAELLAHQQAFRHAAATGDHDALARLLPDDFTVVSHRRLANTGSPMSRDEYVASLGLMNDLGVRGDIRLDHLRISERSAIGDSTWHGTRDGGAFETALIFVSTHDGRRLHSWELFDTDQVDAALARYEDLTAAPTTTARIANAATRCMERFANAWAARDWEVASAYAPGFRLTDRRTIVHLDRDREQHLKGLRPMFDMPSSSFTLEALATRGDRLALARAHFESSGGAVGPTEAEWLQIVEVDDRGDCLAMVMFDLEALDAAYTELDERYAAVESASSRRTTLTRAFTRAFAARDWDALTALLAPELVVADHRLLGWETLHGPAAYIQALKSLVDLAPDVQLRIDHMTMSGHRFLYVTTWVGTREGGPFESPSAILCELDGVGRICRFDQYDLDRLDELRTRLETSGAGGPKEREKSSSKEAASPVGGDEEARVAHDPLLALLRPNAATAASERVQVAFAARDWSAMQAACAPHAKFEDRRPHARVSGDADWWVADAQGIVQATPDVRYERQLVATAGEHVALDRVLWTGTSTTGGPVEVEYLRLTEIDSTGRIVAMIGFDLNDRRAALREAWARWLAADATAATVMPPLFELIEGITDHDRPRLRAVLADDVVVNDYRRTGQGRVDGADAYLDTLAVLWDLAPDIQLDALSAVAHARHGAVGLGRFFGTLRDGGPFEYCLANVATVVRGRISRLEFFELEDMDAAVARLAELRPHSGPVLRSPAEGGGLRRTYPDRLRIPPNAATRTMDLWQEREAERDWEALAELFAPSFVFEDQRRLIRDSGDRDKLIASIRLAVSAGARASYATLATAGDCLALAHARFAVFDGTTLSSEVDILQIIEVDAQGHVIAAISFDPDDRRAAQEEMRDRYFRSDAARSTPPSAREFVHAMNDHDLAGMRAALSSDFYFHDHRRTGVGRIGNADDYIASVAAVYEQSPDAGTETLYHVAVEQHGSLNVGRLYGTLIDGGEFESVFVRLGLYRGGQYVGTELFEIEDLDVARARFEQLRPAAASTRPNPLRIPPNAATRAIDRLVECGDAKDWKGLEALCGPTCVFEDRRRHTLVTGDREMFIASSRLIALSGARPARTLLATSGDRLALEHVRWTGPDDRAAFEIEAFSLTEVDAEGRIIAAIAFDPDARRAASAEMFERYARSDAGKLIPAPAFDGIRAMNDHDLERFRALISDDLVFDDHRRTGVGRLEGAATCVASLAALLEQVQDLTIETLYTVATEKHGDLVMAHMFGTLASGGEFETVYARLGLYQGNRLVAMELFEPEDLNVARARLENSKSEARTTSEPPGSE